MSTRQAFFNAPVVRTYEQPKDHSLKQRILKVLFAYVNHRERIITQHGGHMTGKKLAAIDKIRRYVAVYGAGKAVVIAKLVLQLRPCLEEIMPGRSSKYYEGDVRRLQELYEQCNQLAN